MTQGLICPKCKTKHHSVKETRLDDKSIRRVRICFNNHEFTSFERVVPYTHTTEEQRKRVESYLKSGKLSVPQIAEKIGKNVATIFRIKAKLKEKANDH